MVDITLRRTLSSAKTDNTSETLRSNRSSGRHDYTTDQTPVKGIHKQPTASASDHANELVWVAPIDCGGTLHQQHTSKLTREWVAIYKVSFK